jgi:hypothetical protein
MQRREVCAMKKPAFSKHFTLSTTQRNESGAWVFIGRWGPAKNLSKLGSARVLCIPPTDNPLKIDWSVLRELPAVVWLYTHVDVAALAVVMRAAGAGDLAFFDMASGRFVGLALTTESEGLLAEIEREAA